LNYGAYILADIGDKEPELILMSSGSEVGLMIQAGHLLAAEGVSLRLVSFPSWELFKAQTEEYQESVFPRQIKARLAIEAGVSQGWDQWVGDAGDMITVDRFGASAPAGVLYQKYGLTTENIYQHARDLVGR
jgi:transketolase